MTNNAIGRFGRLFFVFAILATWGITNAVAQTAINQLRESSNDASANDFLGATTGAETSSTSSVTVRAEFTTPSQGKPGYLFVTATIKPGWHIYSLTQKGGLIASKVTITSPQGVRIAEAFRPTVPADSHKDEDLDIIVEWHKETVTWYAPLEFAANLDPSKLKIEGKLLVQACDANACSPPQDLPFVAMQGRGVEIPQPSQAAKQATQPSQVGAPTQPAGDLSPLPVPSLPSATLPAASSQVPQATSTASTQPSVANAGVRATDAVGTSAAGTSVSGTASSAPGNASLNLDALQIAENDQVRQLSIWSVILTGFVGGLILNIMPCVLPVIGLKILSFVEQSGHDRRHALMLNIWYSLGLLSVFWVLATLAVTLGFGWGNLFGFSGFKIGLTAVVFVMGLSFLDVWEVPIPGFIGRGKAVELAGKEGFSGAFSKGALTTILATPCSAPFLAPAITWAVSQPPLQTYAVFTAVGLGMASPYLLIGAFPKLIAFLPKPGAWMDTFKQLMGFVLLGTVVFLLSTIRFSLVVPTVGFLFGLWMACWWIGRVPMTADPAVRSRAWFVAVAIGGAAWLLAFAWLVDEMQARFDFTIDQSIAERMPSSSKSQGNAAPQIPSGQTNGGTVKKAEGLPWQPFTRRALEDTVASGATVLVDFTADWCLTCKVLEATVLNTHDVREYVQANHIVTMKADWTDRGKDVANVLKLLGSEQVPVLAIFPASNPNQPIVLRGGYTQRTLLDALKKAGPSKP
jgi:thiol:disulfide interchange protein DsbD